MTESNMAEGRSDWSTSLSRRTLLRTSVLGGAGLAAAALIGCGGDDNTKPAATQTANAGGTQAAATGAGRLVKDADAPYPYEFPEPASVAPKRGGIFIHATNMTFTPADPTVNQTGGTLLQFAPVYDRLLGYKMGPEADTTKVEVIPGLAESWERSPDGLTLTFKLRGNVKWQNKPPVNGRAFTADDVKYAYERMAAKGVAQPFFAGVTKFEATDPRTLKITLDKPLVDWLTLTPPRREAPIFPRETAEDGSLAKTIIGTSAFMVDKQETERMSFVRNPDYWGAQPYLDGGEVRVMVDASARVAALRAQQVDHAGNVVGSYRETKAIVDSIPKAQVQMSRVLNGGNGVLMNTENPKFKDERVRRALSLGMNRDEMMKIVFDGFARAHGLIPWPFVFDQEPKGDQLGKWMKYDPTQAKQLLDAAGAKDLEINEVHYDYLTTWKAEAEALVNQWKQIGVTLNLQAQDYTSYTSTLTGRKVQEATVTGWGVTGAAPDTYIYDNLFSKSPANRWLINDPKIDELAEKQRVELNPQTRRDLIKQVYDRDLDMMYRIPFPGSNGFYILQPWVRNMRLIGALGTAVETWDTGIQMARAWLDK